MPSLTVDKTYPPPDKLIKNEIETLQTLIHDPNIIKNFGELYAIANSNYKALSSCIISKNGIPSLNFSADFIISKDDEDYKIKFAVDIKINSKKKEYERISYHLAICHDGSKKIIRYFHFDYALPTSTRNQAHPIFHLQYGKASSSNLNEEDYAFDIDNLELPRIPYFPMTLALLLNTVFMEFYNEITHTIINRSEWRKLLKKNEEIMLEPYYRCCCDIMASIKNKSDTSFINDCCYHKKT
jgi:hypothetical protein